MERPRGEHNAGPDDDEDAVPDDGTAAAVAAGTSCLSQLPLSSALAPGEVDPAFMMDSSVPVPDPAHEGDPAIEPSSMATNLDLACGDDHDPSPGSRPILMDPGVDGYDDDDPDHGLAATAAAVQAVAEGVLAPPSLSPLRQQLLRRDTVGGRSDDHDLALAPVPLSPAPSPSSLTTAGGACPAQQDVRRRLDPADIDPAFAPLGTAALANAAPASSSPPPPVPSAPAVVRCE